MALIYGLWTTWGMLIWLITLIIVTPLYYFIFLLGGKKADRIAHGLSRLWAFVGLSLCGIFVKIKNKEMLAANENYIFISNHRSMLDIPVCALATRHFFKFLAKDELTKIPLLGYIINRLYITVSRSDTRQKVRSYQKMKEEINKGVSIWIYPEGSRSPTLLPLLPFQEGAFRLSKETGKKVAIAAIVDSGKLLPPKSLFPLKPGRITVEWIEVISCKEIKLCAEKSAEKITTVMHYELPLSD